MKSLLSQSEYYDQEIRLLQGSFSEISKRNDELRCENARLRDQIWKDGLEERVEATDDTNKPKHSESDYKLLENKLSETKSKLARVQQYQDDQMLVKEVLEKELDVERSKRILAEKERQVTLTSH